MKACSCVIGPPPGGVCGACGAYGPGFFPNVPVAPVPWVPLPGQTVPFHHLTEDDVRRIVREELRRAAEMGAAVPRASSTSSEVQS